MTAKRAIGRPKRSDGNAGRDRLIAAALELMRQPQIELNRTNLAVLAGVTPALVTYYFEDQLSLIEAVAQPLVEGYLSDLNGILSQPVGVDLRLRNLIKLFLKISRDDGRLLDGYIDFVKRTPKTQGDFLMLAYAKLTLFFQECETERYFAKNNVPFSQTVLWGMCKTVAQTSALTPLIADGAVTEAEIEDKQTSLIVDMFLHGLGPSEADRPRRKRMAADGSAPVGR